MKKHFLLLISIFLFSSSLFSQYITVDDTRTAQDLVQNVLFNNTGCATISNFNVSGGDFGTGENSYAYFNQNGSSFPFAEGVVLSTGKAIHTVGPNDTLSDDDGVNWGTDSDLQSIFSDTYNATLLEFDFIPQTNFFSFDYIFASEEYQENNPNTCQYSDVFAFLIKPIGGSYTNIAVVPNTTIPVSVTSVHPEIPNGCPAENEAYFGQWNGSNAPINFNGQTAVLRAQGNVVVGQTYHIKLVIADHTNYRYDSAVFILANSFNVGIDLGQDKLITTQNALCGNETISLDAGVGNNYQWYKNGVPLAGQTNQLLVVDSILGDGTYSVERDNGFGCLSEGSITIQFDTNPVVNNAELKQCIDANTQQTTFNLYDAFDLMNNGDTSLSMVSFTYNGNEIQNPENYQNEVNNQIIQVKLEKPSGCFAVADLTLVVHQNPLLQQDETVYYCLDNYPQSITLSAGLINGNPNANIEYLWSSGETTETIQVNQIGDYVVTVTNSDGCSASRTITVLPSTVAIVNEIKITENEFYPKVSAIFDVVGQGNYQFALDIDSSQIDDINLYQQENYFENLSYGEHILYVKDTLACETLIYPFVILQYRKFLTPNNDGINDTWNINNLNSLVHYNVIGSITIFDRFGRVIAQITPNGLGWNGFYNGKIAPPDDYWFTVKMVDFRGKTFIKRGHFSLN
ncbi:MAG TPA: T9SS type B sorting domain-containing protein [Flavobacteriia bacterium]|nr:T9SS type B sorting domain-containing protein [Flavobacteriia bacterium]